MHVTVGFQPARDLVAGDTVTVNLKVCSDLGRTVVGHELAQGRSPSLDRAVFLTVIEIYYDFHNINICPLHLVPELAGVKLGG